MVDGLNLDHALRKQNSEQADLDLMSLSKRFCRERGFDSVRVNYFTSPLAHLDKKTRDAQARYLEKIEDSGVKVVLGEFRTYTQICPRCGEKFWVSKEKRTDVALASELVREALTGASSEILVFSADTDFLPAYELVKLYCPDVRIRVASTVAYLSPIHSALVRSNVGQIRLSSELVSRHQFESQAQ